METSAWSKGNTSGGKCRNEVGGRGTGNVRVPIRWGNARLTLGARSEPGEKCGWCSRCHQGGKFSVLTGKADMREAQLPRLLGTIVAVWALTVESMAERAWVALQMKAREEGGWLTVWERHSGE
jgi:hypothetical protein